MISLSFRVGSSTLRASAKQAATLAPHTLYRVQKSTEGLDEIHTKARMRADMRHKEFGR